MRFSSQNLMNGSSRRQLTSHAFVIVCYWGLGSFALAQVGGSSDSSRYLDPVQGTGVESLVQSALSRNADLLAQRQRIAEAQGLLRQAGFRVNPGIDVTYGTGSVLGSPGERQLSLGYNHVFELGQKRQRRVEVSTIGIELAEMSVADRERQIRADVRSRYAEALAAIRNLQNASQQLDLNQETFRITQARFRQGEAAALEQSLIQVEVGRLASDRTLSDSQVSRAVFALKPLIGVPADDQLRLKGDLRVSANIPPLSEAVKTALQVRPDLRAARLEETLGDAEIRAARAEAVPNLIASGRYSYAASGFPQSGISSSGTVSSIRDRDNVLSAGISINLPVRNKNQGNIQAAEARREAARRRREFLEQTIEQEIRSAYSRYEAATNALSIFDGDVLNRADDNLRIIRAAYGAGELRLFDVLTEQRRFVDTQRAYTDVLKEHFISLIELERALGTPLL